MFSKYLRSNQNHGFFMDATLETVPFLSHGEDDHSADAAAPCPAYYTLSQSARRRTTARSRTAVLRQIPVRSADRCRLRISRDACRLHGRYHEQSCPCHDQNKGNTAEGVVVTIPTFRGPGVNFNVCGMMVHRTFTNPRLFEVRFHKIGL